MIEAMLPIVVATIGAGTATVFAARGELITEKSGVRKRGGEVMRLWGAVDAFAA